MTERQMEFRVGLVALAALLATAGLIVRFGELNSFWQGKYRVTVHFSKAPSVTRGTPVRKSGVLIGAVSEVLFDDHRGGVDLVLEIREKFPLQADSQATLTRSLLGDATVEFAPGEATEKMLPGAQLEGLAAEDPVELVTRLSGDVKTTLASFESTSGEWRKVGKNINSLVDTNRDNLETVIAESIESLRKFTRATESANAMLRDPENQANLKRSLSQMPQLIDDTRETIASIASAVDKANSALGNISDATAPLARKSTTIVARLDNVFANLEQLSGELNQFSKGLTREEGTLGLLMRDPQLYRSTEQTLSSLTTVMRNLELVMKDLRVFSDKIARHPELIGAGGALKGSSGLK